MGLGDTTKCVFQLVFDENDSNRKKMYTICYYA